MRFIHVTRYRGACRHSRANGTLVRIAVLLVLIIILYKSVSRLEEQEKLVTAEGLYRRALDLDAASTEAQEALRKITETIQVSHSSAIISPELLLLWAVGVPTVAQQDTHGSKWTLSKAAAVETSIKNLFPQLQPSWDVILTPFVG